VNSKDDIDFATLFTLKTTQKAGELQIPFRRRRDQGIAVGNYSFTRTLKPSGFCNVGGNFAFSSCRRSFNYHPVSVSNCRIQTDPASPSRLLPASAQPKTCL